MWNPINWLLLVDNLFDDILSKIPNKGGTGCPPKNWFFQFFLKASNDNSYRTKLNKPAKAFA